ncbi:MAG: ATP-binding protein [Kiritimatiellae bacterium]|nr:ATP-binding protein [Kiritimatiellia bacterium]
MQDYEKLGAFYLGKHYDMDAGTVRDELLLYDAKDLTTHGVCVGMTGSGKTGLCVGLIEEAAIDGIPVLAIDPKGDLGNLLLTFPDLKASDFRPWIDESEALRKGRTPEQYARETAARWADGLAEWGQDGARIRRLRDAAEVAIYTPGSLAGRPVAILRSLAAPSADLLQDAELLQERIDAAVQGLLTLLGVAGDPLLSREHILLAHILQQHWSAGRNLGLPELIHAIQTPPFERVGVLDLESFFPAKARFDLAVRLNSLLASPGFANWLQGEPLDVARLLHSPTGKPRVAILSIAHLSEAERMFFVTLLLNEVLAWMRKQPGTASLRALLYMDEIYGYFPPSANPPCKKPMLTLLKQARAYGVGLLLTTQNPVDLDYKGLANAGTWFIGRLQTERDKARMLEGLETVSAGSGQAFDRARMETVLSSLKSRVFLLNNVHTDTPATFHARWALSYLRGPLTRVQIETLMKDRAATDTGPADTTPTPPATPAQAQPAPAVDAGAAQSEKPAPPAGVGEVFLPAKEAAGGGNRLVYRAALATHARLHYVAAKLGLDAWRELAVLAPPPDEGDAVNWDAGSLRPDARLDTCAGPERSAEFAPPGPAAASARNYAQWQKDLALYLYRTQRLTLYASADYKLLSELGEDKGAFLGRVRHAARESRDLAVAKLKGKYETKFTMLQDRIRRLEQRVEREKEQYKHQKLQTAISVGSSLLAAVFGQRMSSVGRATTAARGVGRAGRERGDIARAHEDLAAQREQLAELETRFKAEVAALEATPDPKEDALEAVEVAPRKSDVVVAELRLAWTPWRVRPGGIAEPLYDVPSPTP